MTISVDEEKAFDKIQHSFVRKILSKLGIERNFLNLIKDIKKKSLPLTSHFIVKDQVLSPTDWEQDKDVHSHHFYSTLHWRSQPV